MAVPEARIDSLAAAAFRIPTDAPEADGTLRWSHTILVVVEVTAGRVRGVGYTYADTSTARLIHDELTGVLIGRDVMDVPAVFEAMLRQARNFGRPGVAAMAISAVDIALWDAKARLLGVPLVKLLGAVRDRIDIYGSGGFTSYDLDKLEAQLAGWVDQGIPRVKMKVGSHPEDDPARVRAARRAIGDRTALLVDGNGAYARKQVLALAESFAESGVIWFEEPVSSDDLEGLRLLRDRAPVGMEIAAGEYGYDALYFHHMLRCGAVDVLQADATRCGGISGWLRAGALCEAYQIPLSAHTAPMAHLHLGCAVRRARHLEYFHDHVRIESMLFDGAIAPVAGTLAPDLSRPGLGIEFKRQDAGKFVV